MEAERIRKYLAQFDYGNRNISPAIDTFWLEGDLRISPQEQVDFLQRFYFEKFNISRRSTEIVKDMMVMESTLDYKLGGKTGTAEVTKTRELGWLVGYLEREETVHFFALNMEGESVWEKWPPQKRVELVKAIFVEVGVLPDQYKSSLHPQQSN